MFTFRLLLPSRRLTCEKRQNTISMQIANLKPVFSDLNIYREISDLCKALKEEYEDEKNMYFSACCLLIKLSGVFFHVHLMGVFTINHFNSLQRDICLIIICTIKCDQRSSYFFLPNMVFNRRRRKKVKLSHTPMVIILTILMFV